MHEFGPVCRVFANDPGDLGSIPGHVIPKILKWYLRPCLTLSNIRYVSGVKWSNLGKGVAPSPTPPCSSYLKGSLLVAFDYGRQLYLLFMHTSLFRRKIWLIFPNFCLTNSFSRICYFPLCLFNHSCPNQWLQRCLVMCQTRIASSL